MMYWQIPAVENHLVVVAGLNIGALVFVDSAICEPPVQFTE
jgi:hypothetical protein